MNKALIDTDILSEIGKAKDATVAANAKTYRRSFGHYTSSTVTVMEIVSGFQKTQATGRLNAFLATLPHMEILPFDQPAAELAGRIARRPGANRAADRRGGYHDRRHRHRERPGVGDGQHVGFSAGPAARLSAHAGQLAAVSDPAPKGGACRRVSRNASILPKKSAAGRHPTTPADRRRI